MAHSPTLLFHSGGRFPPITVCIFCVGNINIICYLCTIIVNHSTFQYSQSFAVLPLLSYQWKEWSNTISTQLINRKFCGSYCILIGIVEYARLAAIEMCSTWRTRETIKTRMMNEVFPFLNMKFYMATGKTSATANILSVFCVFCFWLYFCQRFYDVSEVLYFIQYVIFKVCISYFVFIRWPPFVASFCQLRNVYK